VDLPLLSRPPVLSRLASSVVLSILLGSLHAYGQGSEDAAYTMVREARDFARRLGDPATLKRFERLARSYIASHPPSRRCDDIHLWLGDLLKQDRPRAAHMAYLRCRHLEGRQRAREIEFRFEEPPKIAVERWVGRPPHAGGGCPSMVEALIFFSVKHPQTRRIMPRLLDLHRRYHAKGLKVIGIAAVVDDHADQKPDILEQRIRKLKLPFPVGIDLQRWGLRSVTLERYHGRYVPWAVFLDRYGRIAWLGRISPQPNSMVRISRQLEKLLAQPTLEQLEAQVRKGQADALRQLAKIRTKATATCLSRVVREPLPGRLRTDAFRVLTSLVPPRYLVSEVALGRWEKEQERYRYSFILDRLVERR